MRLALALTALVVASPAVAAARPTELLHEEALANEACRDGSGEHAVAAACELRDLIVHKLNVAGWCYGRPGENGSQQNWHVCGR